MGAYLRLEMGSGRCCYICGKAITKEQRKIVFKGWNASAIIHNEPSQCDTKKRWFDGNKKVTV